MVMMISSERLLILQISTSDIGGAGIAARGLNSKLNAAGFRSEFLALDRKGYEPKRFERIFKRNLRTRIISRILTFLHLKVNKEMFFSLYSRSSGVFHLIRKFDPETTILHVHNWYNMLSPRDLLKIRKAGYKMVFTLHDQRISTGGCHTPYNCEKFKSGCNRCPNLPAILKRSTRINKNRMSLLFKFLQDSVVFVAPSKFIEIQFREFLSITQVRVEQIGNVLDFEIPTFKPRFNDLVVIGVASVNNNSFLKGGDILEVVTKYVSEHNLAVSFRHLDSTPGTPDFANFWESIDYLLLPSRYENSPNVIREAHFTGIPVIASDVGGIREMVDLKTDFLFDPFSDFGVEKLFQYLRLVSVIPRQKDAQISNQASLQNEKNLAEHIRLYRSFFQLVP
jgi:glycosyltransferase involved in cell wall biosynthesis